MPGDVEDVIMGCGTPEGATGQNVGRLVSDLGRLPGLDIGCDGEPLLLIRPANHRYGRRSRFERKCAGNMVGAGVESISLVQMQGANHKNITEDKLHGKLSGALWMPMIETADIVADRYNVSREAQDEYALQSQQRMAAAQDANLFADEIVPMQTKMKQVNKETGEETIVDYTVDRDECNRPQTTLEGLNRSGSRCAVKDQFVTAGNASQLSDGAAAVVVMEGKEAERRGA